MKYDFTIENIRKIIYSNSVPENDRQGLSFFIDDSEVIIQKPFMHEDKELGNSIYMIHSDGIAVSIIIRGEYFLVLYREHGDDSFQKLDTDGPRHILDYTNTTWIKLVDNMEEREMAWYGSENIPFKETIRERTGNSELPLELGLLADFDTLNGSEFYSEGFYLTSIEGGLESWSVDPDFLNSFAPFANANGSGSFYAIWLIEKDLSKCPVVVFGDEGGIHIVAESVRQLLYLLTLDTEISVGHESVVFYKDAETYEESENKGVFLNWLKEQFTIEAIETNEEAEEIILAAQNKYKVRLNEFLERYGISI